MEEAIRSFLREIGTEIVREGNGGELNCRCPLPDHDDKNPSFSINAETGLWNCFGCGKRGDFLGLYASVLEMDIWQAIKEVRQKYNLQKKYNLRFDFPEYGKVEDIFIGDERLQAHWASFGETVPPRYYHDRDLTLSDWRLWEGKVVHQHNVERMCFPVRTLTGGLVAVICRLLVAYTAADYDRYSKYTYWEGSRPKRTLYGIHHYEGKRQREVVVCEGVFDVQRVHAALASQREADVVGLLSTEASRDQLSLLLQHWDRFAVWLDNDAPGQGAAHRLVDQLSGAGAVVTILPYVADREDPAACSGVEILESFDQRESRILFQNRDLENDPRYFS